MKKIIILLAATILLVGCGIINRGGLPTAVPTESISLDSSLVQPTTPPTSLPPTAKPGPTLVPTLTPVPLSAVVDESALILSEAAAPFDITNVISSPLAFTLVPTQSTATFIVGEVLLGQDNVVEGKTSGVTGSLAFIPGNLPSALIAPITINAGTLATDNERRDRALQSFILQTNEHPTIRFTPTAISGLPSVAPPNQPIQFNILGDLQIRDVTRPVTFIATAKWTDVDTVIGTAGGTVIYKDFGLTIPDVPSVASVDDEVELVIDFTARAVR